MANTTTVNTDYENLTVGKNLTPQSALTSKLRTAILCVAFDACACYMCGGLTVDLSADGRISTIITAVVAGGVPDGLVTKYEPESCACILNCALTGTLKVFQQNGCAGPLVELCNCDADLDCQTIKFQVTGF